MAIVAISLLPVVRRAESGRAATRSRPRRHLARVRDICRRPYSAGSRGRHGHGSIEVHTCCKCRIDRFAIIVRIGIAVAAHPEPLSLSPRWSTSIVFVIVVIGHFGEPPARRLGYAGSEGWSRRMRMNESLKSSFRLYLVFKRRILRNERSD